MYHIPSLKLNKNKNVYSTVKIKNTRIFWRGGYAISFFAIWPYFSAGKRTRWHSFPSTHPGDDLFQIYVPSGVRPGQSVNIQVWFDFFHNDDRRWSDTVDGSEIFWNPKGQPPWEVFETLVNMGINIYPFNWLYHRISVPSTVVWLFCFFAKQLMEYCWRCLI